MRRIIFVTVMLLIVICDATAQTCSYCRGGGRVKTRSAVSGYGVNTTKIKCPNCNQLIYKNEEHWDPCRHCGGTGQRGRNTGGNSNTVEDVYLIYLTPAEYSHYKSCVEVAIRGTMEAVTCNRCGGGGTCALCKGSGVHPIQNPDDMMLGIVTRCPVCAASGKCSTCYGNKVTYVYTDKGKKEAQEKIRYYSDLVSSRMNKR